MLAGLPPTVAATARPQVKLHFKNKDFKEMMMVYKSMLTYIKCALAQNRLQPGAAAPHAPHRTPRISQLSLAKRRGSPTRHPVPHGHLKRRR